MLFHVWLLVWFQILFSVSFHGFWRDLHFLLIKISWWTSFQVPFQSRCQISSHI
jgi:hypothetical protein